MDVFNHHLYEYEKGLRNLILHTCDVEELDKMIFRLKKKNIQYKIYKIKNNKVNLFFGSDNCMEVVKVLDLSDLSSINDEVDFILGIMLGYDREKQCIRYIDRKNKNVVHELIG
jgi:hypothetical protein